MNRRAVLLGLFAAALSATVGDVEARPRRRRRGRGFSGGIHGRESADDGNCPCNGGKVCTGPRGGRYCITSSGAKRYGV